MPVVFLTIRGVQAARVIATPAFRSLSSPAQRLILSRLGISAAKGAASRILIVAVIGQIIDPFNRFLVPLSRGLLVTTDGAVSELLRGKVSGPTIATTVLNPLGVVEAGALRPVQKVGVRIKQILFLRQTSSGEPTASQRAIR